jgi:hypothetical protein
MDWRIYSSANLYSFSAQHVVYFRYNPHNEKLVAPDELSRYKLYLLLFYTILKKYLFLPQKRD